MASKSAKCQLPLERVKEFVTKELMGNQAKYSSFYFTASDQLATNILKRPLLMLQEILRLESVLERLYRRATEDISIYIESTDTHVTIPTGALITIHIGNTNSDESVVGEEPLVIWPFRELKGEGVPNAMMSFGDGNHRCLGSYIAIREADIFLHRFLTLEGLHIVSDDGAFMTGEVIKVEGGVHN